jgi:hypothetical protein
MRPAMDSWGPLFILIIGALAGLLIAEAAPLFPICVGIALGFVVGRKTNLVAWIKRTSNRS